MTRSYQGDEFPLSLTTPVQRDLFEFLKTQYNFKNAPSGELKKMANLASESLYRKGQYIFQEGDTVEALYFLLEGRIDLHSYRLNDTKKGWATIPGGNMIAAYELYQWDRRHTESALCLEPCRVAKISYQAYFSQVLTIASLAAAMTGYMAFIIEERTKELMCVTAEEKLRLYLKRQRNMFHRFVLEDGELRLLRDHFYDQIADMTRLTRETVNRELKKMETAGKIRLTPQYIIILDHSLV